MPKIISSSATSRSEAITRAARLEAAELKTAQLAESAMTFVERAEALRDASRAVSTKPSRWGFFPLCCGKDIAKYVAEPSRPIDRREAPKPPQVIVPIVEFTRLQVDQLCVRMKAIIADYDPHGNITRIEQVAAFNRIIADYTKATQFRHPVALPKAIYDQLRSQLDTLLRQVISDHIANGGISLGGMKLGKAKSELQQKLEACLELLPADGVPVATRAAARV